MPARGSDAYKSTSPFELRHASTHRLLFVVVPERRLLAINGAGPRGAADFRLATTLLRTVGAIVRGKLLRVRRGEPVRALLEVTWSVEPGLTPRRGHRSAVKPDTALAPDDRAPTGRDRVHGR